MNEILHPRYCFDHLLQLTHSVKEYYRIVIRQREDLADLIYNESSITLGV